MGLFKSQTKKQVRFSRTSQDSIASSLTDADLSFVGISGRSAVRQWQKDFPELNVNIIEFHGSIYNAFAQESQQKDNQLEKKKIFTLPSKNKFHGQKDTRNVLQQKFLPDGSL